MDDNFIYLKIPRSRNTATLSSFGSRAVSKYVVPNTPTVTTNFVLQGDNGGWSTIAVDEYELAVFDGYLVQRMIDDDGNATDWSAYTSYRATYTVDVSGTRTTYTNETVTFAENDIGFSPIGNEGQVYSAFAKDLFANYLYAAGGAVVADDAGITLLESASAWSLIKWRDTSDNIVGRLYTDIDGPVNVELSARGFTANQDATLLLAATYAAGPVTASILLENSPTNQITIRTTNIKAYSNLIFGTDATYDIGASGATRPRHLYLSGNAVIGGTITGTTTGNANVGCAFVTIGTDATLTSERALTGTSNQITVTDNGAGSTVVLSTPQDIATTSNVTFNNITANGAFTSLGIDDNADAIAITIDSSERVGIGTASPSARLEVNDSILVNSTTNNAGFNATFTGASSGSVGPQNSFTTNDGAAMAQFDRIGALLFNGYDGSSVALAGAIITITNENWSGSAHGSRIDFYATPAGSTTLTRALILQTTGLTLSDGVNIVVNTTTGTKIGTGTTQKLGFWNATPIVQPSAYTQTYSTANKTLNADGVTDPAAYGAGANGYSTGAMAAAVHAAVIALHADLLDTKQMLNSVIDDLQAMGLLA